jgi:hypothetical protein
MADAPWRCSQCGTVNEPVANACRTCGRWPSLFDLEASTIEVEPPTYDEADKYAAQTIEVEEFEPEAYEVGGDTASEHLPEVERDVEDEDSEPPKPIWQRLVSLIVPIGIVLYIVISALANRGGG